MREEVLEGALAWEDDGLHLIDQTLLPSRYHVLHPTTPEEVGDAIRRLAVRGAPAIGIAAAFGLYLSVRDHGAHLESAWERLSAAAVMLRGTRPTAVNLFWAIDRVLREAEASCPDTAAALATRVLQSAVTLWREDRELCRRIGFHGKPLLADVTAVLTHCNAGALATAGWGTATAPLYAWKEAGRAIPVYADETRPLLQGARLTAWELSRAGIPVTVIPDGAAATVMARGLVDAVIVGADRITRSGDVANKIGTYGLALVAAAHAVPFYVAAPFSTFDLTLADGADIPVEERDADEVHGFGGVRVTPAGVNVRNFAFDVTPARLVTAIITDRGLLYPPFADSIPDRMGP